MSGQHEDIWAEVNRIRERQHAHASMLAECQHNGIHLDKLERELEEVKVGDKITTVTLAVVKSDVENLKEIERGRLVKFSIIVGIITVAVQGLAWLLGRLGH